MTDANFRPNEELAVEHPQLRMLVDLAHDQPAPMLKIDAEQIHAKWSMVRRNRRHRVATGVAAAAAVVAMAFGVRSLVDDRRAIRGEGRPGELAVSPGERSSGQRPQPEVVGPAHDSPPEPPRLASTIRVKQIDGVPESMVPLDAHRFRIRTGDWSVDSESETVVTIELPDKTLELRGGMVQIHVSGDVSRVNVLRDEVTSVDRQGRTRVLGVFDGSEEPARDAPARGSGAAALARKAEDQMAKGDRRGAIRSLQRLVSRYGRQVVTQTALVDLGRLLRADGRPDEARCAYARWLELWPNHALAADVRRARQALGPGPSCTGLHPHR